MPIYHRAWLLLTLFAVVIEAEVSGVFHGAKFVKFLLLHFVLIVKRAQQGNRQTHLRGKRARHFHESRSFKNDDRFNNMKMSSEAKEMLRRIEAMTVSRQVGQDLDAAVDTGKRVQAEGRSSVTLTNEEKSMFNSAMNAMDKLFMYMDTNHDGFLTDKEILASVDGSNIQKSDLPDIVAWDTNFDGKVSYDEFKMGPLHSEEFKKLVMNQLGNNFGDPSKVTPEVMGKVQSHLKVIISYVSLCFASL